MVRFFMIFLPPFFQRPFAERVVESGWYKPGDRSDEGRTAEAVQVHNRPFRIVRMRDRGPNCM
jgi:hypothetical protein